MFASLPDANKITDAPTIRDWASRLGLVLVTPADLVMLEETPDGVPLALRKRAAVRALDEIGAALQERGDTLDEGIESGRAIRGEQIRERYGVEADDDPAERLCRLRPSLVVSSSLYSGSHRG